MSPPGRAATRRHRWIPPGLAAELLRFGLVAVAGLGVDLALAWGLAVLAGVPLTLAALAGFCAAAGLNYLLHEYWTFRTPGGAPRPSARRALRYLGVLGLTLAVRLAGVAGLQALAGPAGAGPGAQLLILLAATGLSFVVNYLASKALVFRPGAGDAATAMEKPR